jgi:hypothetical protein
MDTNAFVIGTQFIGLGFTIIAAIFFLVIRRQNIDRYRIRMEMIQKERAIAIEKGVPMPELPDYDNGHGATRLMSRFFHPRTVLGLGIILIFGGVGTCLALQHSGDAELHMNWSMGLIPAFVGVGFVLHYLVTRKNVG